MKNIVIAANTAVGSTLALADAIVNKIDCKVYVLCTDRITSRIFTSSRFINEVVYINARSEQEYIDEVQNWHKDANFKEKPIMYFTTDTTCFYVDNNRAWFETNFELCLPSSDIIQTFTHKGLAEIKAAESGLVVPQTRVIKSSEDIAIVLSEFQFPIILKPRATYLKDGIDFKIKVIKDKNEFSNFVTQQIESNSSLLCQEFVPGGNDASYYYLFYRSKDGNIFESIGRKTLQSTPYGGIMLKGISEFNQELSVICKDFLCVIDYQGIGGIEFKKYNGKFYFIEMSVRLEGFFKISEIAKTPLSLISYYDLVACKIPSGLSDAKQQDGYMYIDFISTFINHLKNRAIILSMFDILKIVFNPKVKLNIFTIRDCRPFLMQVINLFKRKQK